MGTAEARPTGHQSQAIKECIHWAAAAKVGNQTCAQPPSREGWAKGRMCRCHPPTSLVTREDCSQLLDVGYVRSLRIDQSSPTLVFLAGSLQYDLQTLLSPNKIL